MKAGINGIVVPVINLYLHPIAPKEFLVRIVAGLVPCCRCLVTGWADPYTVVLRTAVHVVRLRLVGGDGVKLSDRRVVAFHPGFAVVPTDIQSAIVAVHQVTGSPGIEPERMVVDVYVVAVDVFPGIAAVFAADDQKTDEVHFVGIFRHTTDVAEIIAVSKMHLFDAFLVAALPGRSPIVAAVHFRTDIIGLEQVAVGVFQVLHQCSGFDLVGFHQTLDFLRVVFFRKTVLFQKSVQFFFGDFQQFFFGYVAQLVFGQRILYDGFLF